MSETGAVDITVRNRLCEAIRLDMSNEEAKTTLAKLIETKRESRRSAGVAGLDAAESSGPLARRQAALEAYLAGNYAEAERLLRSLADDNFELPDTHCHLARLLLIQNRLADAAVEIISAWVNRNDGAPYVQFRIFWLLLTLHYVAPAAATGIADEQAIVGWLKMGLGHKAAHAEWAMEPVLAHLQPLLPDGQFQFLAALVAALSDRAKVSDLNRFPEWRDHVRPSPEQDY